MPLLIVGITIGVVQAVGGYYVEHDADMYVHIYTHVFILTSFFSTKQNYS